MLPACFIEAVVAELHLAQVAEIEGYTLEEIADRLGYKTHSAVVKRMEAIKKRFLRYEQESGR